MFYALDLETNTNPGDGLNPTNPLTSITSAAIYFGPRAKETGPEGSIVFDDPNEARLLRSLNAFLADRDTEPGLIVTWNGANFDIPFLITRSAFCEVELDLTAKVHESRKPKYSACKGHAGGYIANWGGHDHADIWPVFIPVAEKNNMKSGLKPMAKHFGFNPIEVKREEMDKLTVAERLAYNVSDVEVTYRLALRADQAGRIDRACDSQLFIATSV